MLLNLAYEYFNINGNNDNKITNKTIDDKVIDDKIKEKFNEMKENNKEKEQLLEDTIQSKIELRELQKKYKL